ncbi:MAG TPA: glycosyltransferase family 2 protein [Pseudomonadota bacterium]|jgi:glycosyltransferase involved in cell wall biosynthesis|nr:glycosyltransferase family 2 protein [Pseudomonadota bacterium]
MDPLLTPPIVSIVIPVYNEEGILHAAIVDLIDRLQRAQQTTPQFAHYELLLSENGSTDNTVRIGKELAERYPQVRILSLGRPNYGAALKSGIEEARGQYVLCDEIDLCDVDFYARALPLLESGEADLVVGSKAMSGAQDKRPFLRRAATQTINGMLRMLLDFRGTDTHGLKAFRRQTLLDTLSHCVVDKDLFASEFVIRSQREGKRTTEIPVQIVEKRPPSINLFRRVPNVLKNLFLLTYVIRVQNPSK